MTNRKFLGICTTLVFVGAAAVVGRTQTAPQAPRAEAPAQTVAEAAFLKQYCFTCHNERTKAAGLVLDTLDLTDVGAHAEVWERVARKIRTGMMPPAGAPRPERAALDGFATALETRLDRAAAAAPDPGRRALHRLNRAEYTNAVRDLLDLEIDATTLLPADDASAGFDNIADVLGVSPTLIEGYVSAASKISRLAVGDPSLSLTRVTYRSNGDFAQNEHVEGLPLGTRGGFVFRHTFPLDAEYELQIRGGAGPRDLDITIDGVRVEPPARGAFRLPITAGPHTIGVGVIRRTHAQGADDVWNQPIGAGGAPTVTIVGPLEISGPGDTPSRRLIFSCRPTSEADELSCAKTILTRLATRAYRRPVPETGPDMDILLGFYRTGRADAGFDIGIQEALARILVDPQFLFRFEREPDNAAPGTPYRITDLELASRLAFFLWSSIPDDELLEVAARGQLADPATFEKQVRRMLADPKSDALVNNFAGQWLFLRELRNVRPESPDFDGSLRYAFQRETELLFRAIVREDRSLVDLLDADFTFVDERLARHYGIPDIKGTRVRRIALDEDSPRRGILGHGSVLTVTSVANRTSPVTRGKWILENLLGTPPPVPPPGVEGLDVTASAEKGASLRRQMEIHRSSPVCASCHKIMDPLGFALENFDLTGKWRDVDGKMPVDASGQLVDGTKLDGPASVRKAILDRSDVFVTVTTEKLLTYAMGRAVQHFDMPAVRSIVREAEATDYKFSSLVLGVAKSMPFQMRAKAAEDQ